MKNLIALGMTTPVIQTSAIRFFIHTSKKRNKVTFNSYNYIVIFLLDFLHKFNLIGAIKC